MRRTWSVLMAAVLLLTFPAAPSRAAGSGDIHVQRRSGAAEDPGVILLTGGGVSRATAVRFGDAYASSLATLDGDTLAVAVPPGEPGTNAPILLHWPGGSVQRVGRFRYDGVFPGRRRLVRRSQGEWCGGGEGGGRRHGASTTSTVKRLPDGTFRYVYEMRNAQGSSTRVRWETLEPLGYTGGLSFFLGPGERVRLVRETESPPVRVRGLVRAELDFPCDEGGEPGVTWDGTAYLPAELVGTVAGPRVMVVGEATGGDLLVLWLLGAMETADRCEIVVRAVSDRSDGETEITETLEVPASDATRTVSFPASGVGTISVRLLRDGVPGEPQVRSVVRTSKNSLIVR